MGHPEQPTFAGAVAPERSYPFNSDGFRLQMHEWGDPKGPPLLLAHGMWDHARGFDTLAPLLAERFRVVSVDFRGHGDSDWADQYAWPIDIADLVRVMRSLDQPVHLVGHSKGGAQLMDAACWAPGLTRKIFNMDGFGPPKEGFVRPGTDGKPKTHADSLREFLDTRRKSASFTDWKPYDSLEALMERRKRTNPRLQGDWLRYFTFHCARPGDDGWRWKVDPYAGRGYGPWNPDLIAPFWARLQAPLLAVVGREKDVWGPTDDALIDERLRFVKTVADWIKVPDAGHFVHMEQPRAVADLILDFMEA